MSVIIVNWNGQRWLNKCLDSLLVQSYPSIEIILVDNGSTDGSVDYIREHFKMVKLITSKENLGFAGGNNLGIQHAQGEYILLLNNDTWVQPDFIERLVACKLELNVDAIAPVEQLYDGNSRRDLVRTVIDPLGHPVYLSGKGNRGDNFYLSGVAVLFNACLYAEVGPLDDQFFMYFEETDWFWRMQLMRKTFCYVEDIFVYHHGAGSTGSGIKYTSFLWRNQNCLQMLLKNYSPVNLFWVLPLYLLQNIAEILVFTMLGKFQIAKSYLQGWYFCIKNFRSILLRRHEVQRKRLVTDWKIMRNMYHGPGKLHHLFEYVGKPKV